MWQLIIGNPLGITRDLFECCLAQSRETIRRLERERLLEDSGFDLTQLNKYASLPSPSRNGKILNKSTHIGRLYSLPGNAEIDVDTKRRLQIIRQGSLTFTGLGQIPTSPLIGGSSTALNDPLTPPPSLSISGDLSTSELV